MVCLCQHILAVGGVAAQQARPLGKTDGYADHHRNNSPEAPFLAENQDQRHCTYHASVLEVAIFQRDRSLQNQILVHMEDDSVYPLHN
jgi:hypothetical protein